MREILPLTHNGVRCLPRPVRLLVPLLFGVLGCGAVVLAASYKSPPTATVHNSSGIPVWLYGATERPIGSKPGLRLSPGVSMVITLNVSGSQPLSFAQAAFDN